MAAERRQINIQVSQRMYDNLGKMAGARGYRTATGMATVLLEAAYLARVSDEPTGDVDLDAAVARAVLLNETGAALGTIAAAVGLSEAAVERIVDAWRKETKGRL